MSETVCWSGTKPEEEGGGGGEQDVMLLHLKLNNLKKENREKNSVSYLFGMRPIERLLSNPLS
jgi:hypothetical protein